MSNGVRMVINVSTNKRLHATAQRYFISVLLASPSSSSFVCSASFHIEPVIIQPQSRCPPLDSCIVSDPYFANPLIASPSFVLSQTPFTILRYFFSPAPRILQAGWCAQSFRSGVWGGNIAGNREQRDGLQHDDLPGNDRGENEQSLTGECFRHRWNVPRERLSSRVLRLLVRYECSGKYYAFCFDA